eukprot:evm.model.scf_339EXC.9 EVM.evm.TU.scf_339EXC.9   scf_339EXC:48297-49077(-)
MEAMFKPLYECTSVQCMCMYDYAVHVQVGSMDRSYLLRGPAFVREKAGPIQTAKLLDAVAVGPTYQVDYMINKPGEKPKRLRSLIALGSNGRVNKLFTLTAQCSEDEYTKYEPVFKQVLGTFKAPSQS